MSAETTRTEGHASVNAGGQPEAAQLDGDYLAAQNLLQEYGIDDISVRSHNFSRFQIGQLVTAYVMSSPRSEDSMPGNFSSSYSLDVLKNVITNMHTYLRLNESNIVVMFDNRAPDVSDTQWNAYLRKINDFKSWVRSDASLSKIHVLFNTKWQHEAGTWRTAWNMYKTPIIFHDQDDSLVSGPVDVDFILRSLLSDPKVNYVKFFWHNDCSNDEDASGPYYEAAPCIAHSSGLLQSTDFYSDRPHFARRKWYDDEIWPRIPENFVGNPEILVERAKAKPAGMWIYGERNNMKRDNNALKSTMRNHLNQR